MRQIFTLRFFVAVGAVVGLLLLLYGTFVTKDVIEGGDDAERVRTHRIDLVDQVYSSENEGFFFAPDGTAAGNTRLVLDASRQIQVVTGTPGENHCPEFPAIGRCAVVADLLGEAVVWLALVPMGSGRTVPLPAIDTLDEGIATLVNGWQLPYAPVLDRRCDEEFGSYRELREVLGDDFTSIYGIDDRRLVAVVCDTRVPFAPTTTAPPTTEPATTEPLTIEPSASGRSARRALVAGVGVGVGVGERLVE